MIKPFVHYIKCVTGEKTWTCTEHCVPGTGADNPDLKDKWDCSIERSKQFHAGIRSSKSRPAVQYRVFLYLSLINYLSNICKCNVIFITLFSIVAVYTPPTAVEHCLYLSNRYQIHIPLVVVEFPLAAFLIVQSTNIWLSLYYICIPKHTLSLH